MLYCVTAGTCFPFVEVSTKLLWTPKKYVNPFPGGEPLNINICILCIVEATKWAMLGVCSCGAHMRGIKHLLSRGVFEDREEEEEEEKNLQDIWRL